MSEEKRSTKENIMNVYMQYVLEHDQTPKSVYKFCKTHQIEEEDFYGHYASFDVLEEQVFTVFFENTLQVLQKSETYIDFDARNRLLSFYYTFFENLTANRSYVLFVLQGKENQLKTLKKLKGLRMYFKKFVKSLEIQKLAIQEERLHKLQDQAIAEAAWIQLLLTLKFWMNDNSTSFEKTDILIEKSVNTSFDVLNFSPVKSIIDLGKFLYKEKIMDT